MAYVFIILVITFISVVIFIVANKAVKKTGWWKNRFEFTKQFDTNLCDKFDVVNLGSNPSKFAFFYENVLGQSWATGSQSHFMDLSILKSYRNRIKDGGTVIISIMPFTSIAPFLLERSDYWGDAYYSTFAKILSEEELKKLPNPKRIKRYLKYPLLYNPRAISYLFRGWSTDNRYSLTEQPMMKYQLEQDALKWIDLWVKEFRLSSLEDVLDNRWTKYYNNAIDLCKELVEYCLSEGLKPVLMCVPMSAYLANQFPDQVWKFLVTDFVAACNVYNIPFLDYTLSEDFQDPDLYFNSFFLNMRGRKLFTQRVLKDLKLI